MKIYILPMVLLCITGVLKAQQRDLNFYLDHAKINSPLIQKNKNNNKILELDLKQIKSVLSKPEINLEASVLFAPIISHDNGANRFHWMSNGAEKYSGYDLGATDGGQYQSFISINQPLFTGSVYRSYSRKADISRQVNDNNIALTIHEIEQIVSYQYILCLKSKIQSESSLSILKELKEQILILQKLVENAIYKQTDLMLLQIEYQNYELENKTFEEEYKSNLYDLNLICGINDTNNVDIREINFQIKPDTLSGSQFLISYRLDSLSIVADQEISDMKYKPQLNLFANAGLNAVYQPSFDRFGFSTGLSLSWNIYDGHQRKMQREISNINLQNLELEKKNFVTQHNIYKNKFLDHIHSLDQRIGLSEGQIGQYDKLLDAYSKELSQGEISMMDYKNIMKESAAKKLENLLLKMEKQVLINSYNYWNY